MPAIETDVHMNICFSSAKNTGSTEEEEIEPTEALQGTHLCTRSVGCDLTFTSRGDFP